MQLNPMQTYLHLSAEGRVDALPGGDRFWSLPASQIERFGHGWLVSEYEFNADWPHWEMHPIADEVVYVLSGSIDFWLEQGEKVEVVEIRGSGAIVVPRGVWHTVKTLASSRLLHMTMGAGTQHKPLTV